MAVRDVGQRRIEAGERRNDAHIRGCRLDDDRGDVLAVHLEHLAHRVEVVVGQHEGLRGDRRGNTGRPGQGEGRDPEPAAASRPSE